MARLHIIDDEPSQRSLLAQVLRLEGHEVREAATLKAGLDTLKEALPEVLFLDVRLPDGNGVEATARVKELYPSLEIIVLTAHGNLRDGVDAMRNGAFDYLTKGNDNGRILPTLARALQKQVLNTHRPRRTVEGWDTIGGAAPALVQARELARQVAPTDATVLLLGETGTGKEVFARAIHMGSPRAGGAFIAVNCGAFTKELLESELFGYKAGAFTGAVKDKVGLVEAANGGTLFLDEIGEMGMDMQAKLLRLLEAGTYRRLGDTTERKADVRFLAATNRNLRTEAEQGRFRLDLYYRLSVFEITLPPLRERKGDVEGFATHFLDEAALRLGKKLEGIRPDALALLTRYAWPGNVRELKNMMERAAILAPAGSFLLTAELLALPQLQQAVDVQASQSLRLEDVEQAHIRQVLAFTRGNKTEAAKLLGIGLTTLYRKLEEYGEQP